MTDKLIDELTEIVCFRDSDRERGIQLLASIRSTPTQPKTHRWNDDGERCLDCGDKDWMNTESCRATTPPDTQCAKQEPREIGLDPVKIHRQRERDKKALETILTTADAQLNKPSITDTQGALDVDIATNEKWFLERVDGEDGDIFYEIKSLKENGAEWNDDWIKVMGVNAKSNANTIYRAITRPSREAKLLEALKSIADNTCCDSCREAGLVAKKAIAKAGEEIISKTETVDVGSVEDILRHSLKAAQEGWAEEIKRHSLTKTMLDVCMESRSTPQPAQVDVEELKLDVKFDFGMEAENCTDDDLMAIHEGVDQAIDHITTHYTLTKREGV